ncbi:hypothetical protein KORDIASMS9_03593 [Kordia sp. SMS9]|uniref:hypothetical protein n=1 Tax=Kordia sp. SMS9 TaxID=2282170 RepID=UPI000E0CF383|nr:hypothetical protein [Kordia sp. SMS9]AXG71336.1 hypothetical protein KORDIASMS9_03593 [Kordia sp. SMS9]
MNRKHIFVIVLNLCIAFGYYFGNLSANETHLSSDLHNIIPICLKMDDPTMFPHDTFANDLENVKYYTPFYVETLRFLAKFTDGDYVQALNILTFICHILFGLLLYFLLFKITNNFWASLVVSLLLRGTIWLPGLEYWGISDLWSMMPRVVYYALLPLPFLFVNFTKKLKLFLAAFTIGFLLNFHPITGLSGILIFLGYLMTHSYLEKNRFLAIFNSKNLLCVFFIFLGMLPFFINYTNTISVKADYDLTLYKEAFAAKYPIYFTDPTTFWKEWLKPKFFIYGLAVIAFVVLAYRKGIQKDKRRMKYMLIISTLLFLLPNAAAFAEAMLNKLFEVNIRMSFQLVRMQKLLILAAFFSILFSIDILYRNQQFKRIFPMIAGSFLLVLVLAKHSTFDNIPFVSNDLIRRVLPNSLSLGNIQSGAENEGLYEILTFIRNELPKDALLFAPDVGRSGGQRSVVLDSKGANMLIEGNPKRFLEWYTDYKAFKKLSGKASNQFLRDYGVDYVLIYIDLPEFKTIMKKGKWRLYEVNK